MIDCSITKNYLAERARMTKCDKEGCKLKCSDCPLHQVNNGKGVYCGDLEPLYPETAIEIVQKWSDEHPQI